jgi:alanine dehydrogenase
VPFVREIAMHGPIEACRRNPWLARGLTTARGVLTLAEAAKAQARPYTPVDEFLASSPE